MALDVHVPLFEVFYSRWPLLHLFPLTKVATGFVVTWRN